MASPTFGGPYFRTKVCIVLFENRGGCSTPSVGQVGRRRSSFSIQIRSVAGRMWWNATHEKVAMSAVPCCGRIPMCGVPRFWFCSIYIDRHCSPKKENNTWPFARRRTGQCQSAFRVYALKTVRTELESGSSSKWFCFKRLGKYFGRLIASGAHLHLIGFLC